jgi:prepilin-type N-terminal cleavage/methylation domain-containing protein
MKNNSALGKSEPGKSEPGSSRWRRYQHRGFSLVELLMVIFMLTVFIAALSRLFVAQVRTLESANSTLWTTGRFDHLITQMRKDVWNSTSVEVLDNSVHIHQNERKSERALIQWSFADDQLTRRQWQGNTVFEMKKWEDLGLEPKFEIDGSVLVLTIPQGTPHGEYRIRFQSQLRMATKVAKGGS